jgi:hypothetical protein
MASARGRETSMPPSVNITLRGHRRILEATVASGAKSDVCLCGCAGRSFNIWYLFSIEGVNLFVLSALRKGFGWWRRAIMLRLSGMPSAQEGVRVTQAPAVVERKGH